MGAKEEFQSSFYSHYGISVTKLVEDTHFEALTALINAQPHLRKAFSLYWLDTAEEQYFNETLVKKIVTGGE